MPYRDPEIGRVHHTEYMRRRYREDPEFRDRQKTAVARTRAQWKARVMGVIDALKAKPCTDCGGLFPPECMDFDHLLGTEKLAGVAMLRRHSLMQALSEIAKCELVCANCHRIRTRRRLAGRVNLATMPGWLER